MTAFAALLLVGLVALSSANPDDWKPHCITYPAVQNFNAEAFFNGTWYLTEAYLDGIAKHIFHGDWPFCTTIESEIVQPVVYLKYTINGPHEKDRSTEGVVLLPNGVGNFMLNDKDSPYEETYTPIINTIIETDYETYAISYNCVPKYGSFLTSGFTVLGRSSDPKEVQANVEAALNKVGVKISDFGKVNLVGCQN